MSLVHRFVEQVFGAYLLGNTPATGVIDLTPNPAPASVHAPIVVHILQVCIVVLWSAYSMCAAYKLYLFQSWGNGRGGVCGMGLTGCFCREYAWDGTTARPLVFC